MPQFSNAVRDARANQFEIATGASAKLRWFTGAPPANCAAASTGTQLAEAALPSDWMNAASGQQVTKLGTWQATGSAAGNIGYYRILDNAGTTCHAQGNVTATGGGGDMTVDNVNIAIGQVITVTAYTINEPNG